MKNHQMLKRVKYFAVTKLTKFHERTAKQIDNLISYREVILKWMALGNTVLSTRRCCWQDKSESSMGWLYEGLWYGCPFLGIGKPWNAWYMKCLKHTQYH